MRIPAIFAPMLRERGICIGLLGLAGMLVGANRLGWTLWPCVFYEWTGRPCPGCGLTRGVSAFARGDFSRAFTWNPFTPLAVMAAVLMITAALLPLAPRLRLVEGVARLEQRTGITFVLIAAFIGHGLWRMFAHPHWPG